MRKVINIFLFTVIALFVAVPSAYADGAASQSTRNERNAITEGNKLYNSGKYRAAMQKYQQALKENPSSAVGRYNLGLSQIQLGSNPSDTTHKPKDMLQKGCQAMEQVSKMGSEKPDLAARANYNLGNVAFNSEQYQQALGYYKQALRLNPDDNAARRNLRITQLKLQDQNQDDDNKDDKQDQNQDKQDQNQDQQQNQQNQDQNKDRQQNQDQQQQQPNDINQQTADQILKAMENKENQTRARVGTGNNGEKSTGRNRSTKNW